MTIENFKMFKPSAYNFIKGDYGDYSGDFHYEFLRSNEWCPSEFTQIDKPKMGVKADKNYYAESRFAEFEFGIVNSVMVCIEYTFKKVVQNLLQHFRVYLDV